jgi:hypothetical protein
LGRCFTQNRFLIPLASAFLTLDSADNPDFAPSDSGHNTRTTTFLGTIKKWGDSFWLANTSKKVAARLGNSLLPAHFVNQKVKITGTIDLATNVITVLAIAPCA